MAGYSGTPLPNKLWIEEAHRIALLGAPAGFDELLGVLPTGAVTKKVRCARSMRRGRGYVW